MRPPTLRKRPAQGTGRPSGPEERPRTPDLACWVPRTAWVALWWCPSSPIVSTFECSCVANSKEAKQTNNDIESFLSFTPRRKDLKEGDSDCCGTDIKASNTMCLRAIDTQCRVPEPSKTFDAFKKPCNGAGPCEGVSRAGIGAVVPDFSYAGWNHGETPIPQMTGTVYDVTHYGATPNDDQSDRHAVELAIEDASIAIREKRVSAAIIFFPPGRFPAWPKCPS